MKIFGRKPDASSTAVRAGRSHEKVGSEYSNKASLSNSSPTADTVKLSKDGAGLADAIRAAASEPLSTTSLDRLAELKDAIESGTYEIDSTALAEAILREDLSADGGEG